jgi:hypothetical protein
MGEGTRGARRRRGARTAGLLAVLGIAAGAVACVDQSPMLFQSRPTPALCVMYYLNSTPQGYSEANLAAIAKILDNRGAVGEGDWQNIHDHKLKIGLTGCSALAILGEPISTVDKGPVETLTFPGNRIVQLKNDRIISFTP